ncbi:ankyrin repeat-containing protein NPR4-like isoform X1 [Senna tora]|uniref:Ankyrin repeat-containing protein NPR4-like isoform X1 n=1 Tax=Senna tora TaxID=362788 RepID=A0A834TFD2_9FABA|nr:ankyrin repeat-containing protein NPR4-like isoform X1 [Senna tora]
MRAELATNAIFYAAREGNAEFVEQLAKANPHLILHNSNILGTPFSFAIQNRQAEVFNLFHQFRLKNFLATIVDQFGNGLLHVAGMMAPSSQLNRISGAALQMQRELQWFKEVESVIPHGIRVFQNIAGYKPIDVFKESHKELRNEGEKWMKDTSSSCSVVGALIVTIMFAAAFTVPGGNNQETGYPMDPYVTLCRRRFSRILTQKVDHRAFYTFSIHCNNDDGLFCYHSYHGAI